jgi:formiminotetrahydrofolate cyclodeaminase
MSGDAYQGVDACSVGSFLNDLASTAPTPGGGAAAALVGAMCAALVAMVANLTVGRPRYEAIDSEMRSILERAEGFRRDLVRLADDDARAYGVVAAAMRLPRKTDEERASRDATIQLALLRAAEPPAEVMDVCRALVPLCLVVAAHGNANVASDAGVAAELAASAVRSSIYNVRVNLAELKDQAVVSRYESRIAGAESGLSDDVDRVTAIVRAKIAPKART